MSKKYYLSQKIQTIWIIDKKKKLFTSISHISSVGAIQEPGITHGIVAIYSGASVSYYFCTLL